MVDDLEVCWGSGHKPEGEQKNDRLRNYHSFHPEPSQPHPPMPMIFNPEEKRGDFCVRVLFGYRFLSIRISTAPTTTIATMIPMVEGTRYMSATDAGVGVGVGVGVGASVTDM